MQKRNVRSSCNIVPVSGDYAISSILQFIRLMKLVGETGATHLCNVLVVTRGLTANRKVPASLLLRGEQCEFAANCEIPR